MDNRQKKCVYLTLIGSSQLEGVDRFKGHRSLRGSGPGHLLSRGAVRDPGPNKKLLVCLMEWASFLMLGVNLHL